MPSAKSIFKLIIILAAIVFYFAGPSLISPKPGLSLNPAKVKKIELHGKRDSVVLEKKKSSLWTMASDSSIKPDQSLISNLLWLISTAEYIPSSQPFTSNDVEIELVTTSSNRTKIQLGQRLKPFKSQLIKLNGKTYEINKDLNACLGIWQDTGSFNLKKRLAGTTLISVPADTITNVRFSTPVTTYEFSYQSSRWTLRDFPQIKVKGDGMTRYLDRCSQLSTLDVTPPNPPRKFPYSFRLKTDQNDTFELELATPTGTIQRQALGSMRRPTKQNFVIDGSMFHKLIPSRSSLISNMPQLTFKPEQVKSIKAKSKRAGFTLANRGKRWAVTRPVSSKKIAMVQSEPGKRVPATNVYVEQLAMIQATDLFSKSNSAMTKAQRKTIATITIELKNGKRMVYKLSPIIANTNSRLLSYGKTVLIIPEDRMNQLIPDADSFFTK